jgi:hypothetical protein
MGDDDENKFRKVTGNHHGHWARIFRRQDLNKPRTVLVSAPGFQAPRASHILEAGLIDEIGRMAASGAFGAFASLPGESIAQDLWSIATGMTSQTHDAAWPNENMPTHAGESHAETVQTGCPPLWEISARQNIESCAIAWPGVAPPACSHLLVVTDKIHIPFGTSHRNWPMLPGAVYCSRHEAAILGLRVHPGEIPEIDLDYMMNGMSDPVLRNAMRNAIAAAATVQAITLDLLARNRHSVIAVHFDILNRVRCMQGVTRKTAANVILRAHQFFNLLIGNLRSMLCGNTMLIIVSPPTRDAAAGVHPGGILIWGAGIEPHTQLVDPRMEDIAPTALQIVGCAIPPCLSGRPLIPAGNATLVPDSGTEEIHRAGGMIARSRL